MAPTPTAVRSSFADWFGTTDAVKTASVETSQKLPITESTAQDAFNAKLVGLFWGQAEKAFAVSDSGGLTQVSDAKADTAGFAALFSPKLAPQSATVVISSGEDRLNVLVRQPASLNDDDLDASFAANGSATWFANVRDAAPVGYITEANHDHTLHDVYDVHALFG